MPIVLTKDLIMDNSHSFVLSDLPISAGEKFTVIVMRDDVRTQKPSRRVYAHRIAVDDIVLPPREELHER